MLSPLYASVWMGAMSCSEKQTNGDCFAANTKRLTPEGVHDFRCNSFGGRGRWGIHWCVKAAVIFFFKYGRIRMDSIDFSFVPFIFFCLFQRYCRGNEKFEEQRRTQRLHLCGEKTQSTMQPSLIRWRRFITCTSTCWGIVDLSLRYSKQVIPGG